MLELLFLSRRLDVVVAKKHQQVQQPCLQAFQGCLRAQLRVSTMAGQVAFCNCVQLQPGARGREFNSAQSVIKLEGGSSASPVKPHSCPSTYSLSSGCSLGKKLLMFWLLFYTHTYWFWFLPLEQTTSESVIHRGIREDRRLKGGSSFNPAIWAGFQSCLCLSRE